MKRLTHRTSCRVCGHTPLERIIKFDPIALPMKFEATREAAQAAPRYPISLNICSDCGHVQQTEIVDDETLWVGYTYQSSHAPVMPRHFQETAAKIIERFRPAPGSLIIDIGSNDGSFLRPFKDAGYRVLGIEMVKEIAAQAQRDGIETIGEPLSPNIAAEIRAKYGPAAIITAFNVLAHSDDLHSMVRAIQSMIDAKGVFVYEVQYLRDVIDRTLVATVFHEHLSHHTVKSMRRLLSQYYMDVFDVDLVPIQHGSMIGYAQFQSGPHPVSTFLGYLQDYEKIMQYDKPEGLRKFARNVYELRTRCEALVALWRSSGATVAGYGAAMSGPGLISMLGLTGAIGYIVDDHPQKVGLFSPGDGL